jgi:predicted Zn-dependent protease with MMP-like domain
MRRPCDSPRDAGAERYAPSLDQIEALARDAFDKLPDPFRRLVGDVTVSVAELPDDDMLDELEMESPFDLLGLFEGIGLAHASAAPPTGVFPNRVWLFRRPILDYWAEHEETLGAVVTHVLVHEIGQHFGLSDEDMEAIEAEGKD